MSHDAPDGSETPSRAPTIVERCMLGVAVGALGMVCLLVTYMVVARALGHLLIPDDVRIVQQLMVIVVVFPMATVTARRMHIAVTIFSNSLSSHAKRCLGVFADVVGVLLVTVLLVGAVRLFLELFASGEYYNGDIKIPYWYAQGLYVLGLAALWGRAAAMVFVDAAALSSARDDYA